MAKIKDIKGLEILDSRGNPTVAAAVVLDSGASGQAAAPSGASTGKYNRFLWIESELGADAVYGGRAAFPVLG